MLTTLSRFCRTSSLRGCSSIMLTYSVAIAALLLLAPTAACADNGGAIPSRPVSPRTTNGGRSDGAPSSTVAPQLAPTETVIQIHSSAPPANVNAHSGMYTYPCNWCRAVCTSPWCHCGQLCAFIVSAYSVYKHQTAVDVRRNAATVMPRCSCCENKNHCASVAF